MISFTPFPYLETKNLILRRLDHADTNDLFEMRKDPRMNEYTDTKADATTEDTREYIDRMNKGIEDNKWIIWGIEHKQSNKVIGTVCIWNLDWEQESGELGYGIIPDYQGRGLMKEALTRVIEYGFNVLKLRIIDAYTEENNVKSVKLLERCNFTEADRVDEEGCFNNCVYHMIVYRLKNNNKI